MELTAYLLGIDDCRHTIYHFFYSFQRDSDKKALTLPKILKIAKRLNENVEKPSLEAFGMTILAVMSYQTTPWEELAKKPSIRKTLKYVAIRENSHYDEMEALAKELIRKHFDGITQKMALGFLKIIRGVSNEERPTKLIEYTPFPAQYYAIHHGLHQLIRDEHPDDAAVIIHCAIEDGILFPIISRKHGLE